MYLEICKVSINWLGVEKDVLGDPSTKVLKNKDGSFEVLLLQIIK